MKRAILATSLIVSVAIAASYSQTVRKPEDGFISPKKYTNAFWGFTLPLPQDEHLVPLTGKGGGPPFRHTLFGVNSNDKGYSVLMVIADDISFSPDKDPKMAVLKLGAKSVDSVLLGGKEFFRGEWQSDKIRRVVYASELQGYVLYITVFSFDKNALHKFEGSIRGLTFFDPAMAKEEAGPESQPYNGLGQP